MIQHGTSVKYRMIGQSEVQVKDFWGKDHGDQSQAFVDTIREIKINQGSKEEPKWIKIQDAKVDFFRCKPIRREIADQ